MDPGETPSSVLNPTPELTAQPSPIANAPVQAEADLHPTRKYPGAVTLTLAAAMCAIAWMSLPWDGLNSALAWGVKTNDLIRSGQWWRLLSCLFLHSGAFHLAFNVYALLVAGGAAERAYGYLRYLALFVIGGACASYLSYRNSEMLGLGASGAIFGVVGSLAISTWRRDPRVVDQFTPYSLAGLGVWIVGSLITGNAKHGVDNAAHLGGIIGGAVASVVLVPDIVAYAAALLSVAAMTWTGIHVAQSVSAWRASARVVAPSLRDSRPDPDSAASSK
jgi:membrane associated rhomboid family serine protease